MLDYFLSTPLFLSINFFSNILIFPIFFYYNLYYNNLTPTKLTKKIKIFFITNFIYVVCCGFLLTRWVVCF